MAQLVKLLDYISRYENDLTRYPTQFIRLKRKQWDRMKIQWESGESHTLLDDLIEEPEFEEHLEKRRFPFRFNFFGKRQEVPIEEEVQEIKEEEFDFTPNILYKPKTIEELRRLYVDQLFHFQMKWASSTLLDESKVDPKYLRDPILRAFTQRLPDSYLLFYEPIVKLKKAPIQMDVILITPVECMCITVLNQENMAVYVGSSERFWTKKVGSKDLKVLNPLIALNRNEKIIHKLFAESDIQFPVKKYLLSENGYIDFPNAPYDCKVIDKRSYEEWFASLSTIATPLKLAQFQAAKSILDVVQTTTKSRLREEVTEESETDEDAVE